jgi:hypothetical protein
MKDETVLSYNGLVQRPGGLMSWRPCRGAAFFAIPIAIGTGRV